MRLLIFINTDSCELGFHPFPWLNMVMTILVGGEEIKA
jgi:hypothetical protein